MVVCPFEGCGYTVGWISGVAERVDGEFGEFYKGGEATRFHGEENVLHLMGCPKCYKTFLSKEDI